MIKSCGYFFDKLIKHSAFIVNQLKMTVCRRFKYAFGLWQSEQLSISFYLTSKFFIKV